MTQPTSAITLPTTQPSPAVYRQLADDVELNLKNEILGKWYPRAVDEKNGGFHQNFNQDWTPGRAGVKGAVYQSRLTWTATQAAGHFPAEAKMYEAAARHGLQFLTTKLWDAQHGGFFWSVDDSGVPTPGRGMNDGRTKQGYGNAFAIFAAASVYKLTKDPAALDLAKKGFAWYDQHGHDNVNGGYFEILTPEGTPDLATTPAVGGGPNSKSMNTSIHLLEAYTALYEVWPDPLVKQRMQEMYEICRDKLYADPGYLILFFTADWKPKPNAEDSYGHDVETAFLLTEAAHVLGIPDDAKAWDVSKKLVDHAIAVGWDKERGGLYNHGGIDGGHYAPQREWWVHAEFLNALLLLHERYGRDNPIYWQTFLAQWDWVNRYGIDRKNGGWWPHVNNDGTPVDGPKSDAWTECYHQGRAMLTVCNRLRKLAETVK
ncbi:MAG TPA: AGE family epimerase/isomerase [Tepidisphaeraceae bacterium]|jgi:mannobiose 2-epimerase